MTKARVLRNNIEVGFLQKEDDGSYTFFYTQEYLDSQDSKRIAFNFPLQAEPFYSEHLFSFFFNMLSEGNLKKVQCRNMRIDEDDSFTRLLKTAKDDTIGAVTIEEEVEDV